MSDKPEPLAAILAEMRGRILGEDRIKYTLPADEALAFIDRIEAAAERERNAHTNDIHNALYMATGIPGNAAAMRESIETMRRYAMLPQEQLSLSLLQRTIHEKCDAALAAPARNCDRFQNWHDAMREEYFTRSTPENVKGYPYGDEKRWREFCDWLFAPAEGGKE